MLLMNMFWGKKKPKKEQNKLLISRMNKKMVARKKLKFWVTYGFFVFLFFFNSGFIQ